MAATPLLLQLVLWSPQGADRDAETSAFRLQATRLLRDGSRKSPTLAPRGESLMFGISPMSVDESARTIKANRRELYQAAS